MSQATVKMNGTKVQHEKCENDGHQTTIHHKRKYCGRVKRACQNCKKSKRCCDSFRPCSRCSRLGFEDTCIDAEKKEKDSSSDSGERIPKSAQGKRPKKVKQHKECRPVVMKKEAKQQKPSVLQTQLPQSLFEPNQLEKELDLLSQMRFQEEELQRRLQSTSFTQSSPSQTKLPPSLFPNQEFIFNYCNNDLCDIPQYLEYNPSNLNQTSNFVPGSDITDEMLLRAVEMFAGQEFGQTSEEEVDDSALDQVFMENSADWIDQSEVFNTKRIDEIKMYNKLIEDVRKSGMKAQRALQKIRGITLKENINEIPECAGTNLGDFERIIEELQRLRAALNPSALELELQGNPKEMAGTWLLKHGKFVDWNSAWDNFGYSENDLFTKIKTWKDFVHSSEWERIDNMLINAYVERMTEFSDTFTIVHKSGQLSQVHITFVIIYEPGTSMSPLPSYTLCYNRMKLEN